MTIQLGVLGVGHLASALLDGVLEHGVVSAEEVLLMDLDAGRTAPFARRGCQVASDAAALAAAPRLLLSVRPQSFADAAGALGALTESNLVISVMAGGTSEHIRSMLGGCCRVVRVMPNTAAAVGESMTTIAAGATATAEDLQWTTTLFDAVGRTCVIDESLMSAATAVCGSGPGWLKLFGSALAKAAMDVGFDADTADRLVRQTLLGAATTVRNSDQSFDALLDAVATAGGTTEAGLAAMRNDGFEDAVRRGVIAARDRGDALST